MPISRTRTWNTLNSVARMAEILRDLHRSGIRLYQIEPFIGHLLAIHDRFADGQRPSDLPAGTVLHTRLLGRKIGHRCLARFLHGVDRQFLRGHRRGGQTIRPCRCAALRPAGQFTGTGHGEVIIEPGSTYIEAGQIHYPIWRELRQLLPAGYPLRVHFLMSDVVRSMGYRTHLYGPGDLLTLLYRFHSRGTFPRKIFSRRGR